MSLSQLEFVDHSDNDWQVFAAAQGQANIFHHTAWSRLMQESYGYVPFVVVLRGANGNICAGLPMMEVNRMFGRRRWVSVPFSDHCAPLCRDSAALRRLTEALISQAQKPKAPKIELRWTMPPQSEIRTSAEYVLHTIQLDSALEKVADRIHHSHRRNIRTAKAHDVQIKFGRNLEDVNAFYLLHLQTRHRQGIPIQPYHYFELLYKRLIVQGLGFVLLAYANEQCLAGAIFLHWHHTLTYKYGASRPDGLHLRPNHLIFWNAIQWGCNNGYSNLDLGRTDLENHGLREFKERWGANETKLSYSIFPAAVRKQNKVSLLPVLKALIRNLPISVCQWSGELFYRYFG
jgi:CelD/BcsL family acetyltransferase involved in cellulose biosynthesis